MAEDRLSAKVAELQQAKERAEAALLERDGDVLNLRFESDGATATIARLRKQLRDMQVERDVAARLVRTGGGGGGGGGAAGHDAVARAWDSVAEPRKAGERFKRERDLEEVVTKLKRVVEKLQTENDRLKRHREGGGRETQLAKEVRELRSKLKAVEDERERAVSTASGAAEGRLEITQLKDNRSRLQRDLKRTSAQVESLRRRATEAEEARRRVESELEECNGRNQRLTTQLDEERRRSSSRAGAQGGGMANTYGGGGQGELEALRKEVARMKRAGGAGGAGGGGEGAAAELERQCASLRDQLREERRLVSDLKSELGAFDHNFFEEVR